MSIFRLPQLTSRHVLKIGEVDYIVNDLTTGQYGDLRSKDALAGPSICCDWFVLCFTAPLSPQVHVHHRELSDVLDAGLAGENYKYYAYGFLTSFPALPSLITLSLCAACSITLISTALDPLPPTQIFHRISLTRLVRNSFPILAIYVTANLRPAFQPSRTRVSSPPALPQLPKPASPSS